jgi:hypothetical protein
MAWFTEGEVALSDGLASLIVVEIGRTSERGRWVEEVSVATMLVGSGRLARYCSVEDGIVAT